MPVTNVEGLIQERAAAIREYHFKTGIPRAELDISGGADSAVMAGLLALAIGPENITLVHTNIATNPEQTGRAERLAKGLGIPLINFDMNDVFSRLMEGMTEAILDSVPENVRGNALLSLVSRCEKDPTIMGSIRSCIRAPIGRGFSRLLGNGIRHGTGNECEDRFLRYYQKGGDGEVDTNPLEMLSKTEIYQIAFGLCKHFPEAAEEFKAIIKVAPSADLWASGDEQTDEDEIKNWLDVNFTYGRVDPETGEILSFGTIERMNRFLDLPLIGSLSELRIADLLFHPNILGQERMEVRRQAMLSGLFGDLSMDEVLALLEATRKAEKATKHKENPGIPSLGHRDRMVGLGLLTDILKEGTK